MNDANLAVELLRYEFSKQSVALSVGCEKVASVCEKGHVGKANEFHSFLTVFSDSFVCRRNDELKRIFTRTFQTFLCRIGRTCGKRTLLQISLRNLEGERSNNDK